MMLECKDVLRGAAFGNDLPESIQLFPPGVHKITATSIKDGKKVPVPAVVTVDESTAAVIASSFEAIQAKADAGTGPAPYVDFNHDDSGAAAWVKAVFWAGSDPMTGGVRARVEWTDDGKNAILGKRFRQFSPNFGFDEEAQKVAGTGANMGGLVNRPAFHRVQPFFAADGSPEQTTKPVNMNKQLLLLLASHGYITSATLPEEDVVTQVSAKLGEVQKDLKTAETAITDITAKANASEVALGNLKISYTALSAKNAEATVTAYLAKGVGNPKDAAWRKTMVDLLAKDPENEIILKGMVKATDPTRQVTTATELAAAEAERVAAGGAPAAGDKTVFMVRAEALAVSSKIKVSDAIVTLAAKEPALYEEYRKNLPSIEVAGRN